MPSTISSESSSQGENDSVSLEPLQARLMACLKNTKVADVHLVGDDGVQIPALRCVLSCTSPVFEVMLYGEFSESKKSAIPIAGANSNVLQNLVDYCCSDTLSLTLTEGDALRAVSESIMLAELGDKYQIPGLESAVSGCLRQWIEKDPPLACVVFDVCHAEATPEVRDLAWQVILERPHAALQPNGTHLHGGITSLSHAKLQELFQGARQIRARPLYMFERLLDWYLSKLAIEDEDKEQVAQICREAAGHIHLAAIDPRDLQQVVNKAPFIDKEDVMNAFMEQAMLAQKFGLDFSVAYRHGDQPQCRRVLVEGAGVERINGIYLQDETPITALIQQQFTKRIADEQIFLVQGREDGLWFICDPTQYYYHCKSPHVMPSTGWIVVSDHGVPPAPTCKFFFYNDVEEGEEVVAVATLPMPPEDSNKQQTKTPKTVN